MSMLRIHAKTSREITSQRFWYSYRCTLVEADKVSRMNSMEASGQTGRRVAENLWGSCRREALDALYHPFVVSLAAGTLPKASFQQYIVQDAYFLEAFSKA